MAILRLGSIAGCFRHFGIILRVAGVLAWILVLFILVILIFNEYGWLPQEPSFNGMTDKDRIMAELGFVPDPVLYPHSHHRTADLPVFIATIRSEDMHSFHRFLGSFRLHFRERKLVVYDMGLTSRELDLVRHTCQCLVRKVHWDRYPPHIQDMSLKAYRPILIQETLREFGIVFWCHHEMRFTDSNIDNIRARAEAVGLVTWPSQRYPTSTFTHDAMLSRYGIERRSLYFQHMAEPETALYVNTYRLHHKLMKPWVLCALDLDCLAPFGARRDGCDMTLRPRYRYAGCHRYDTSAFNVLLGQMFYFDDTNYIPTDVLFHRETTVPTVQPRHKKSSPTTSPSRRSSNFSSQWENQESSNEKPPILFKLKQRKT